MPVGTSADVFLASIMYIALTTHGNHFPQRQGTKIGTRTFPYQFTIKEFLF
jgi:hypothetical protein